MGADYERAMPAQINFDTISAIVANQTRYHTNDALQPGINNARYVCTRPMTIDHIWAMVTAAPGAGETATFTLMVNGLATAITVQIAGAVQVANNAAVGPVVINAGDYFNMRIVTSLNCAGSFPNSSIGGRY